MQVETSENEQNSQNQIETTKEENKTKDDGLGQAQMEENIEGHSGKDTEHFAQQKSDDPADNLEKKRKPGESDSDRTLGNVFYSILSNKHIISFYQQKQKRL